MFHNFQNFIKAKTNKTFFGEWSLDQNSVDRNCVLSVDRNFHNQLTEFFESFQLIKKFDQLPKKNWQILAVDQNFLKAKNTIIRSFDQLKMSGEIRSTDQNKNKKFRSNAKFNRKFRSTEKVKWNSIKWSFPGIV